VRLVERSSPQQLATAVPSGRVQMKHAAGIFARFMDRG